MAIIKFTSGSATTLIGTYQEVTEAIGFTEKIQPSKIVFFGLSGAEFVVTYVTGIRQTYT